MMDEFKRYFGVPNGGFEDCDDWKYEGLEEGWKAALEWLLECSKKDKLNFFVRIEHIKEELNE